MTLGKPDTLKSYFRAITPVVRAKLNIKIAQHMTSTGMIEHYLKCWRSSESKEWFTGIVNPEHPTVDELANLHGFMLLWLDDTRNSFSSPFRHTKGANIISFGEGISFNHENLHQWRKVLLDKLILDDYALSVGGGSVGLALRLGRGVCLRDTVRDTRGSVSTEDFLSRNFSYIGIPIRRDVDYDAGHHNPVLIFSLLFPARGAWHDEDSRNCCASESADGIDHCLYNKIMDFCDTELKPLAMIAVDNLESRTYERKVREIAELGDEGFTGTALRSKLLDKLVQKQVVSGAPVSNGGASGGDEIDRDLLGFRVAGLFEGSGKDGGPNAQQIRSNLDDVIERTCKNTYASSYLAIGDSVSAGDNTPKHPTDIFAASLSTRSVPLSILFSDGCKLVYIPVEGQSALTVSEPIRAFWESVTACSNVPPAELRRADATGLNIGLIKWADTVLTLGAELLVNKLVACSYPYADASFEFLLSVAPSETKNLRSLFEKLPTSIATLAFMTKPEAFGLSDIVVHSAEISKRINEEFFELPFSRRTLFGLVTALKHAGKLSGETSVQVIVSQNQGVAIPEKPLRCETWLTGIHNTFYDLGAMSAVTDQSVLRRWYSDIALVPKAWSISCVNSSTYKAELSLFNDSVLFSVILTECPANTDIQHTLSAAKKFRAELAMAVKENAWSLQGFNNRESEPSANPFSEQLAEIISALETNGCGYVENKKECFPFATKILKDWCVSSTKHACENNCHFVHLIKQVVACAEKLANVQGIDAIALGINSYLIVPLLVSAKAGSVAVVHGFLLLGSAKREYDTVSLVTYSSSQLQVVRFAADYLELTIGQEKQADASVKEKAIADAVRHLEGIVPEVRSLIEDITEMKWRAERIGRKISPASYGVFAYDSETADLFATNTLLDVVFCDANFHPAIRRQSEIHKLMENIDSVWEQSYSLTIGPAGKKSGATLVLETLHRVVDVASLECLADTWAKYQIVFFILGLSRGNEVLKVLGRYKYKTPEEIDNKCIAKLYNAAKLVFHRLHAPGDDINSVYTVQLLAAFAAAKNVTVSCISDANAGNNIIATDPDARLITKFAECITNTDWVSERDACDSCKWMIGGPAKAFLAAISQFVNVELRRDEITASVKNKHANYLNATVTIANDHLELVIKCNGEFNENNLHYQDVGLSGQPYHGLTQCFLTLRQSFRGDESALWAFNHGPIAPEPKSSSATTDDTPNYQFTFRMPKDRRLGR